MEELYECTDKLCGLKEKFTHALERASCDLESLSTDEAGKVVDIIKDLAQTEKYCMESCYYKTVIHAMHEGEGRYGYIGRARIDDPRRSWKYKQYKPFVDQEPYIFDYMDRMDHMPLPVNHQGVGQGVGGVEAGYGLVGIQGDGESIVVFF